MTSDGSFMFYMVQHQEKDGEWVFSNLDHYGTPPQCREDLHKCWYETGESGATFEVKTAKILLKWIRKKHPAEKFRLVVRHAMQATIVWPEAGSGGKETGK